MTRIALTILQGPDYEFGGLLHLPEGKTVQDIDMNALFREWDAADRPDESFTDWLCHEKGFSEDEDCGFAYVCVDEVLREE